MSQIICQNLAIGYDGKAILKDINFSINEGDYLCIIGENGSGKSTLMRTYSIYSSQLVEPFCSEMDYKAMK